MERLNIFVLVFICIITGMLILTISLRASADSFTPSLSGSCSVSIHQLPTFEPLFLVENFTTDYLDAFVLPNSDGYLNFNVGDKFSVSCPGDDNFIVLDGALTTTQLETAQCEKGTNFKIIGKSLSLYKISCSKTSPPRQALNANKPCGEGNKYKLLEIGFTVDKKFIKHLEVCYDDALKHSLYSHQILGSSISGGRRNLTSSDFDFIAGDFYDKIDVTNLYKKTTQMQTINGILNLDKTDTTYINDTSDTAFLSKGHYSAKTDFVYGSQQILTYYYVNAAPQWYTFNSGNWKTIEIKCRELANSRQLNLNIITGSHGVSKLFNKGASLTELYLLVSAETKTNGIPVPWLYYKVVYDQKSLSGVAFVGVNNPYMLQTKVDIICEDVCDQIEWIGTDWTRKDISSGYLYCCNIDDLRKTIVDIPPFNVTTLLK